MTDRVRVFTTGTEWDCWLDANCERCPAARPCDLEEALWYGAAGDGTIAPEIAARLGYREELHSTLGWPCKKRVSLPPADPKPAAWEMRDAGAPMLPGLDAAPSGCPGRLDRFP